MNLSQRDTRILDGDCEHAGRDQHLSELLQIAEQDDKHEAIRFLLTRILANLTDHWRLNCSHQDRL